MKSVATKIETVSFQQEKVTLRNSFGSAKTIRGIELYNFRTRSLLEGKSVNVEPIERIYKGTLYLADNKFYFSLEYYSNALAENQKFSLVESENLLEIKSFLDSFDPLAYLTRYNLEYEKNSSKSYCARLGSYWKLFVYQVGLFIDKYN